MNDVSFLYRVSLKTGEFSPLASCNAMDLKVKEKQIEEWMALKPNLLFSDENAVMIISQELSGELQADLLAVDSQGNLIVIEIKRHWSDRNTVGQLLDYAARLSSWNYESFNKRWRTYTKKSSGDLFESFKIFAENQNFEHDDFLKTKRLYILASEADEGLRRIINWLKLEYKVPIDFIPFSFFKDGNEIYLRIEKIDVKPISKNGIFEGDWFFNTNETYAPGAWENMLIQNVIAAYGYGQSVTKRKMDMPAVEDRVFLYLNGRGIIASGKIIEDFSIQGNGIFNKNTKGDEFHRQVEWLAKVPIDKAITSSEVSALGYNLPVRCTMGKWNDSNVAEQVSAMLYDRQTNH